MPPTPPWLCCMYVCCWNVYTQTHTHTHSLTHSHTLLHITNASLTLVYVRVLLKCLHTHTHTHTHAHTHSLTHSHTLLHVTIASLILPCARSAWEFSWIRKRPYLLVSWKTGVQKKKEYNHIQRPVLGKRNAFEKTQCFREISCVLGQTRRGLVDVVKCECVCVCVVDVVNMGIGGSVLVCLVRWDLVRTWEDSRKRRSSST